MLRLFAVSVTGTRTTKRCARLTPFIPATVKTTGIFSVPTNPKAKVHDLVKPYPASHGCVRVLRPKIHYIFQETPIGRKVVVYGSYS